MPQPINAGAARGHPAPPCTVHAPHWTSLTSDEVAHPDLVMQHHVLLRGAGEVRLLPGAVIFVLVHLMELDGHQEGAELQLRHAHLGGGGPMRGNGQ